MENFARAENWNPIVYIQNEEKMEYYWGVLK
jgi:hypothetical protein